MPSFNDTPPTSELDLDYDATEALYPDPARVPPYVAFVEASSLDPDKPRSLGQVEVEIVPMTAAHADWWHKTMQPIIKAGFRSDTDRKANPILEIRADAKWNWNTNFRLLDLHNLGHFSTHNAHPAFGLTMITRNSSGEHVPVGMITLVPRYLCYSNGLGSKTYTWFVSAAPEDFYEQYFQTLKLHGVGKALFDAAIVASYRAGLDGSLLLHAAPGGGSELRELYEKLGFESTGSTFLPITLARWTDRDGYMLLQAKGAAKIIKRHDPYRRKGYIAD